MSLISSKVFIPDEDYVWLAADVLSENIEEGSVHVRIDDVGTSFHHTERTVVLKKTNLSSLPIQNADIPKTGVEDMCTLSYLHEASILDNLKRYSISIQYF